MTNFISNNLYVIFAVPVGDDDRNIYLSDGYIGHGVFLRNGISFDYEEPCLACANYDYEDGKMIITDLQLIVTNINRVKAEEWLQGLISQDLTNGFLDIMSLIVLIEDNDLRRCVTDVFFDDALSPIKLCCVNDIHMIERMYENIFSSSMLVYKSLCLLPVLQYEKDMYMLMIILQELAKCELCGLVFESDHYSNVHGLVEHYVSALKPRDYKEHYKMFCDRLNLIGSSMAF